MINFDAELRELMSEVTIIIPTKDRVDMAESVIRFWTKRGAKILILDASNNSRQIEWPKEVSGQVRYHWASSFWERFKFAAEHIETEFAIIHSDDSLLSVYGMISALKSLKEDDSIDYLYSVGHFSSTYISHEEDKSPKHVVSEHPLNRMRRWAMMPNDFMWGALFRSRALKIGFGITGKTTHVFSHETGFTNVALYLALASVAKGKRAKRTIHYSRHWSAPIDESMIQLRSTENPFHFDFLNKSDVYENWKHLFLREINQVLNPQWVISESDFTHLLDLYVQHDLRYGNKSQKWWFLMVKSKQKLQFTLKRAREKYSLFDSFLVVMIINLAKKIKLLFNQIAKNRELWIDSKELLQFDEAERRDFGLDFGDYNSKKLKSYRLLFPSY